MEYTHGGDVYRNRVKMDFSANIGPFGMPESVREAAIRGVLASTAYPDSEAEELRNGIAGKEGVLPEQIVCGNGAAEVIYHLAAALKPKHALLLAPTFSEYEHALRTVGCQCRYYFLREKNGFRIMPDILDQITEVIDLVLICNPNNPTGVICPKDLYFPLMETCRLRNCVLAVDECFQDFLLEEDRLSFMDIWKSAEERRRGHLFVLKAFTKMYGIPGLRMGYGISTDRELVRKMKRERQAWNVSMPAQYAGFAALKEEDFAEKTRNYVAKEREWMKKALAAMGFHVFDSKANYIFFKNPYRAELYDQCLKKGILIRKCENYLGLDASFYRIAVKTREENEELLRCLESIVRREEIWHQARSREERK